MKKDCIGKISKPIFSYCYNFFSYGHKSNKCRKPRYNNNSGMYESTNLAFGRPIGENNVIKNGFMCYKCNKFGHIARDRRLQNNQFGPRYQKNVIAC